MPKETDQQFDDQETANRRDAALLRALSTPHKKQADMKLGKRRGKAVKKPKREVDVPES